MEIDLANQMIFLLLSWDLSMLFVQGNLFCRWIDDDSLKMYVRVMIVRIN